jgi:DNA-binding NarL/FixJ family response regulator
MSNTEMARTLFLSEGTVKNHVSIIFSKLGVTDRTQMKARVRILPAPRGSLKETAIGFALRT